MAHLLVERSTRQQGTPRVDLEAGIIYDVKFLGNDSENGRRYGYDVRKKALPLYEGAIVNQNHPANERKLGRQVQEWVGVLENVRAEPDGSYGNLRMRKQHQDFAVLMEAAKDFWENFGLSHIAFGDGKKKNGIEVVTTIENVRSVDIVLDPATCSNLYESKGKRMAATATTKPKRRLRTLSQIIESTGDATGDALKFRKLLKESTEGDAPAVPAETQAAVPEGASTEDALKEGVLAGIIATLRESDPATIEKVAKTLGLGTKLSDMLGGKPAEEAPAADSGEETPMTESKAVNELQARLLLLEAGHKASDISDVMVESLAACPKAKRRELLASWKLEAAAPATTAKGKPKASPPAFLGDEAEDEADEEMTYIESKHKKMIEAAKQKINARRRV